MAHAGSGSHQGQVDASRRKSANQVARHLADAAEAAALGITVNELDARRYREVAAIIKRAHRTEVHVRPSAIPRPDAPIQPIFRPRLGGFF